MRPASEILNDALREQVKSKILPFLTRFGFQQHDDLLHFSKGSAFIRITPDSYHPHDYPWTLSVTMGGNKSSGESWEQELLSKDRAPYYTRTIDDIRESISRVADDLEEHWTEFLKGK
jgi:hypothetical protein